MVKVKVYLKSGNIIDFKAKNVSFKTNGNEITGYTIEEHNHKKLYFNLDSIEAIIMD